MKIRLSQSLNRSLGWAARLAQRVVARVRSSALVEPQVSALHAQHLVSHGTGFRLRRLALGWLEADHLFKWGSFQESASLRSEILEELYSIQTQGDSSHWPHGLSFEFGTNIGHHAISLICAAAIKMGRLGPHRSLMLPIEPKFRNDALLEVAAPQLSLVPTTIGASFTDLPSQWHIFNRLQCLKTVDGFEEIYHFKDKFLERWLTHDKGAFEFPESSCDFAITKLRREHGLPNDAWYVGLHIRDDGSGAGRRNQTIESYLPAIKEVVERGGWVIRLGDASMQPLPSLKNVIDLVSLKEFSKTIHTFVLATSRAFIGTQSGPSSVPPLFGVPTVVTNATSIGRNTLPAGPKTIYVPKTLHRIDKPDRPLSFEEHLATPDAYGELSLEELASIGFGLTNNSSLQILEAVRELLSGKTSHNSSLSRQVTEIRQSLPFASRGKIAESFLESQDGWLH